MINEDYNYFLTNVGHLKKNVQIFHWNVTGGLFIPLHEFYGKQYIYLNEQIDSIAEHIKYLGGYPTLEFNEKDLVIKNYQSKNYTGEETVVEFEKNYKIILKLAVEMFEIAKKNNDISGEAFFQDFIIYTEQALYFVQQMLK